MKKQTLSDTIIANMPSLDKGLNDKELIDYIRSVHQEVSEIEKNNPKEITSSYPKDFGYTTTQEYYEEPWVIDLRSSIARYMFCLHTKTNKIVKGKRSGNPHKTVIHVTIGRRENCLIANAVADLVVETIRKRSQSEARAALESARSSGKELPDTRVLGHSIKKESGGRIVAKVNELADDAMLKNTELQTHYSIDLRFADRFLVQELGGRQMLNYKKLKNTMPLAA